MARLYASSQYAENVVSSPITAFPLTVAGWFYSDDATVAQCICQMQDKDVAGEFGGLFAQGAVTGDPVRWAVTGATALSDTTTGYSTNTWHHAAGVSSASNAHAAYIDGGSKGTSTVTVGTLSNWDSISIGRQGDSTPGAYMSGRIAEVGVWNVALSDKEVLALARGVSPRRMRPGNLVFYAPLWGNHSPEIDVHPASASTTYRAMTLTGPPTKANHAPVTIFTPKWAATMPVIEEAAAGRTTKNTDSHPLGIHTAMGWRVNIP